MAVVATFDGTGLVIGVSLTVFADTSRTNQTVIVGPVFPSTKSFPDELSVTPSLSKPEPHLWDFRECPEVHHAPERKYSRVNCLNQAIEALKIPAMSVMGIFRQLSPE